MVLNPHILKSVLRTISFLTNSLCPPVLLHCIGTFLSQYWQREAGQHSHFSLLCCCSHLLPSVQLPVTSANGSRQCFSWPSSLLWGNWFPFHGSGCETWHLKYVSLQSPASMKEGARCLVQPLSALRQIRLRLIFVQRAGCCSAWSVVHNSSPGPV